jgi:glycerol-3-phosphate acyltransferase PlsX
VIAVDANGADRGPAAVAEGARLSGVRTLVFGPVQELGAAGELAEVVDAPIAVTGDDEPARAVRTKPDASVVQAARAVGEDRAEALVSAGATGGVLASAVLHVKRVRGVHRPALAVLLPVPDGPTLLLDAGANVEVRAEHLVQFAHMGACFMQAVHGIPRPRVGLLSVGEESAKGTPVVLEAHRRIAESAATGFEFAGNVEGFDLPAGTVDVVVSDGFTGNIALKVLEGTAKTVSGAIREAIRSGSISTLGGLLIRGRVQRMRDRIDPERVGGAILLGLRKPVIVAHGSFGPEGIASAIRLAQRAVDERMVDRTREALERAGALRSVPVASVAQP